MRKEVIFSQLSPRTQTEEQWQMLIQLSFARRQRDIAKKQKKEQKRLRRTEAQQAAGPE